jgi:hypothetical protein
LREGGTILLPLSLKEERNGSEVKTVLHPSENRYIRILNWRENPKFGVVGDRFAE